MIAMAQYLISVLTETTDLAAPTHRNRKVEVRPFL
jgi:hypothetical protein